MTVTVLIVDDHPVVREGLRGMLAGEPHIEVLGEAGDGHEAAVLAGSLGPDVVLMDLRMPGTDGVEATRLIANRSAATAVLIMTTYDTDNDIIRAVEAGAKGYPLKDTPRDELVRAVRAAAVGGTVLAPTGRPAAGPLALAGPPGANSPGIRSAGPGGGGKDER